MGRNTVKLSDIQYGLIPRVSPLSKRFYVLSSASSFFGDLSHVLKNDVDGEPRLVSSIDAAMDLCVANRNDEVIVLPGHTETVTAAITLDVAGVKVIGVGEGTLKPSITVGGAIDGVDITAANVVFENFHFTAPSVDAATAFINVSGAGVTVRKITGIGSTTSINCVDCITIASGANDLTIEDVEFFNTTVAVNSFLSIEAAVARLRVKRFFAFGDVATAGVIDAATATQILLEDVRVGVVGSSKPAATLDSNPTGFVNRCRFAGTSTTLAANAALGTGVRIFDTLVLEETGGAAQGALIPAVDAE